MALLARKRLAQRIKAFRHCRGWSQEVLAEICGLNRSYIGAVERAEHNVGLDNIQRIAAALEVNITNLISGPIIETPADDLNHSDQVSDYGSAPVIISRQSLLELLNLSNQKNSELILAYLRRCGVIIQDADLE
jgi:transcriptional regulator with XRE-family HTH domain